MRWLFSRTTKIILSFRLQNVCRDDNTFAHIDCVFRSFLVFVSISLIGIQTRSVRLFVVCFFFSSISIFFDFIFIFVYTLLAATTKLLLIKSTTIIKKITNITVHWNCTAIFLSIKRNVRSCNLHFVHWVTLDSSNSCSLRFYCANICAYFDRNYFHFVTFQIEFKFV